MRRYICLFCRQASSKHVRHNPPFFLPILPLLFSNFYLTVLRKKKSFLFRKQVFCKRTLSSEGLATLEADSLKTHTCLYSLYKLSLRHFPVEECLFLRLVTRTPDARDYCVTKMMARQSTVAVILLTTLLRVCRSEPCSDDYLSSRSKVSERAFEKICEYLPEVHAPQQ